jgi:DNA-binding XRE family transcriptional regulator
MTQIEHKEFYDNMGSRIREARLKAEISQDVLAQHLGLTRASIVNIEKGRQRPMIHTLFQIAEAVKVNLTDLIPGIITPPPIQNQAQADQLATDFDNIISDDFTLDLQTKDAVKQFVFHLKK